MAGEIRVITVMVKVAEFRKIQILKLTLFYRAIIFTVKKDKRDLNNTRVTSYGVI